MTVEEMKGLFLIANINVINIENNCFQEQHGAYEDYYELELVSGMGKIYYITQERNSKIDLVCTFNSSKKAISFFTLLLLSKRKDRVIRRNEDNYVTELMSQITFEKMEQLLVEFKKGVDYDLKKDLSIDINVICKNNLYQLIVNKHGEKVYSLQVTSGIRAQLLLVEFLYMNLEIKEVLHSAFKLGIHKGDLTQEEYSMYFGPFEYMRNYSTREKNS